MSVLSGTLGVLSDLFFLFTVCCSWPSTPTPPAGAWPPLGDRFPDPVAALDNFARGTRNYMGVSASFGLIVAVIDGLALYFLGVPGAFVWAVLAFVTNFIPNIGFIIGVIPPALIALLDGGPGLMVTVIVVYSVVNFVIQSVIQPRVVGDAVGLSATLTFLSLVFWTWVVGPLGALLAVPLSLLAKALLVEADPRARWALPLISGKPDGRAADPSRADGPPARSPRQPGMRPRWTRTTGAIAASLRHAATGPTDAARVGPRPHSPAAAGLQRPWCGCSPLARADRAPGAPGFVRLDMFDRSMTIAAQFFTSVLPILILFATWAVEQPTGSPTR